MKSFPIITLTPKQPSFKTQTSPVIRKRVLLAKHAPASRKAAKRLFLVIYMKRCRKINFNFFLAS